jgi:hypothetical protein
MASAAGGTSQREKPGPAIVRSLSKKPGFEPGRSSVAVLSILSPQVVLYGVLGSDCNDPAAAFLFETPVAELPAAAATARGRAA